jgi:hypothetical protein
VKWNVHHARAFLAWIAGTVPTEVQMTAVQVWIDRCIDYGPPDDCRHVENDLYLAWIRDADVMVSFIATTHDQYMRVKEFR